MKKNDWLELELLELLVALDMVLEGYIPTDRYSVEAYWKERLS
jgi:hypothetical protein